MAAFLILHSAMPVKAEQGCGELLDKNCTSCHYKTRICQKIGQKSKRGWKITVKRMLRYGLQLDARQQEQIIECLNELKEGSKLVCE